LQQGRDVVRDQLAVALGRSPQSLSVTADELADLAFNPIFARLLFVLGSLGRLDSSHDGHPLTVRNMRKSHPATIAASECDHFAASVR
jgi:hypothetical protein